jgi:hypothetical protein
MSDETAGFGIVPRYLRGTLTALEIAVYVALSWRADEHGVSWASQKVMAEDAGMSRASLQRSLDSLEGKGLVQRMPWTNVKGTASNVYALKIWGSDLPSLDSIRRKDGRPSTRRTKTEGQGKTDPVPGVPHTEAHPVGVPQTEAEVCLPQRQQKENHVKETKEKHGDRSVVVSPPVTRERTSRTTPGQKLAAVGVAPRDRGRFKEFLRVVKGARSADAVIAAADLDDLADQVREWRASLNVQAEPDSEPILCDHGHDVSIGQHMCPLCDPARRSPSERKRSEDAGARMPEWLREALEADPEIAVPGALLAPAAGALQ